MHTVSVGELEVGPATPPRIMGIVNLSPESSVSDSVFDDPDAAATHIESTLQPSGADMVDIGLQSTADTSPVASPETEHDRLADAIAIRETVPDTIPLSIETRYGSVASAALDAGFDLVNDVGGLADPEMLTVVTDHKAPVVVMAGSGSIERPGELTSVDERYAALATAPLPNTAIVDPAFGQWQSAAPADIDVETLRRLREFRGLGHPLLVSLSHKELRPETPAAVRSHVTAGATTMAVAAGADIVRTHDVAAGRACADLGRSVAPSIVTDPAAGILELQVTRHTELAAHLSRLGIGTGPAERFPDRVVELTGLAAADQALLESSVTDRTADLFVGTDDRCILVASHAELETLHDVLADESDRLSALIGRLLDGEP